VLFAIRIDKIKCSAKVCQPFGSLAHQFAPRSRRYARSARCSATPATTNDHKIAAGPEPGNGQKNRTEKFNGADRAQGQQRDRELVRYSGQYPGGAVYSTLPRFGEGGIQIIRGPMLSISLPLSVPCPVQFLILITLVPALDPEPHQ